MHTLYDFMTHIKGVEYILAIMFIAGYLLFTEVLKPKPFASVVDAGKDDAGYLRGEGLRYTLRTAGKIAAAPFIGIAYVIALPFAFIAALGSVAAGRFLKSVGGTSSFGWRPGEAYLTGKKTGKAEETEE